MNKTFRSIAVALVAAGASVQVAQADEVSLPDGYVRLEGVMPRSSLYQYIQTDFTPCSTDSFEMDFTFFSYATSEIGFWAARSGLGSADTILVGYDARTKKFTTDFGNNVLDEGRHYSAFTFEINRRYRIALDGRARTFFIDETKLCDLGSVEFGDASNKMKVFASEYSGRVDGFARDSYMLHAFRVTGANGMLRLNLIPAFEKRSGLSGLYDTVGSHFYTASNQGGGYLQMYYQAGTAFGGGLPPNYRRLKAVTPSGVRYLNTFLTPLASDTMEMSMTFSTLDQEFCLWCSRGSGYAKAMMTYYDKNGNFTVDCGSNSSGRNHPSVALEVGRKTSFKVDYAESKFYVSGLYHQDLNSATYDQGGSDLVLFAAVAAATRDSINPDRSSCWKGNAKFHSAKLTGSDGTMKMNLVPCYEVATETAGLFDTARGMFLTLIGSDNNVGFEYDPNDFEQGMMILVR